MPGKRTDDLEALRAKLGKKAGSGWHEIQLVTMFNSPDEIRELAPAFTLELLALSSDDNMLKRSTPLQILRRRGLLHLVPAHILRKATAMELNQESQADTLVNRLLEADYAIDQATKYRSSTAELAKATAPDPIPRYRDLYAEFDYPVKLLAIDPDVSATGPAGYIASGPTMVEAVAQLKEKCERRQAEFGGSPSDVTPPVWLNYMVARGLIVFIGHTGKLDTVVSRFEDADLTAEQVDSIFTMFWDTSQADELNWYTSPDGQLLKKVPLAKFGRLARRAVRHKVKR